MAFEYLNDLNDEQRLAATTKEGFVRIIAGAGTGKTKTLISRTTYLLDTGVDPSNILLITFTKKAAKEMCERINLALSGRGGNNITATTFHSLCANEVRKYAGFVGYQNNFEVLSSSDATQIMNMCRNPIRDKYLNQKIDLLMRDCAEKHLSDKETTKKLKGVKLEGFPTSAQLIAMNSDSINSNISLESAVNDYFLDNADGRFKLDQTYIPDAVDMIRAFGKYKVQHNMMDFDDLLAAFFYLLSTQESIRASLDHHFAYIMCDEYQDTNIIQDYILMLLSRDVGNLCVVGDDNQSIYKFRGAKIGNILDFEKRYPGSKTVKLIQNYRSTQEILDVSNAVMDYAKEGIPKKLIGQSHGEKPELRQYRTSYDESTDIAKQIKDMLDSGMPPKEIAVIARNSNQTFALEKTLRQLEIPYAKYGGKGFFEYDAVVMILSLLRAFMSVDAELAWLRVLGQLPKVGEKKAQTLYGIFVEDAKKGKTVFDTFDDIIRKNEGKELAEGMTNLLNLFKDMQGIMPADAVARACDYYEETEKSNILSGNKSEDAKEEAYRALANEGDVLKELTKMAGSYIKINEMIDDFLLNAPANIDTEKTVTISTVHSVKGLEFHTVFLIDPILGVFPRDSNDSPDAREDLRCMYVALTRAKKQLFISYPREVEKYGGLEAAELSPHLNKESILATMNVVKPTTPDFRYRF